MNALEKEGKYYKALKKFSITNPEPEAIVVVSSHWETENIIEITGSEVLEPLLLEDEEQKKLKSLKKTFIGNPSLARSLAYSLKKKGIKSKVNMNRGIDHGAWVPIYLMYPEKNIPIIQFSLPAEKGPKSLFRLGNALKSFRKDNILFLGSGNVVFNPKIKHQSKEAPISGWAKDFDAWIEENMFGDLENLFDYQNLAPNANYAMPTSEHISPMFVILGLKNKEEKIKTMYEGFEYSTTSMRCFQITN